MNPIKKVSVYLALIIGSLVFNSGGNLPRTELKLKQVFGSENGLTKNTTLVRIVDMGDNSYKMNINLQYYLDIKSSPHPNDCPENLSKYTNINSPELTDIIETILELPTGNNERDAQEILDFVHRYPYIPDNDQYIKKPIETLVEGGGDCEDLSVFAYSLMKRAGLDPIYIVLPPQENEDAGHLLVGVAGNFEGAYIKYKGKKYFLAETTGTDWSSEPVSWKIGQLPDDKWTNIENIEVYKP